MSYGKVHDVFWESHRIDGLSDRAALLALFLITGPHRNAIGCFRLGTGAITDNPRFQKWGIDGVSIALREMSECGFIVRDDRTGWTFVTNALKHDPITSPKVAVHALSLASRVPTNTAVYQQLKERLEPHLMAHAKHLEGKEGWPMSGAIDTPSNGYQIPVRFPEPIPEPIPDDDDARAGEPEVVDGKAEAQQRVAVGHRIVEAMGADPTRWAGDFAIVSAWLKAGYDPDLDIVPTVQAVMARKADGPPKALKYFTEPIAKAHRERTEDLSGAGKATAAQAASGSHWSQDLTADQAERMRLNVRILGGNIKPSEFEAATGIRIHDATSEQVEAFVTGAALDIPGNLRRTA